MDAFLADSGLVACSRSFRPRHPPPTYIPNTNGGPKNKTASSSCGAEVSRFVRQCRCVAASMSGLLLLILPAHITTPLTFPRHPSPRHATLITGSRPQAIERGGRNQGVPLVRPPRCLSPSTGLPGSAPPDFHRLQQTALRDQTLADAARAANTSWPARFSREPARTRWQDWTTFPLFLAVSAQSQQHFSRLGVGRPPSSAC